MTEGNSEKEGIYIFDYTIKDAELTLTWPTWSSFSHINAIVASGEGFSRVQETI